MVHAEVSVLMDSVDEWGLRGSELTKVPTVVGAPQTPKDITVPPATYVAQPRVAVLVSDPKAARGEYPKVYVASGKAASARAPESQMVRLPYTDMLNADYPAEAAVNYYIFRLMGWPDVKVWAN
jgi:3-mercaptopyruvate sulfurtransferase SseA